jgi:hypothetical protein
MSPSSLDAEIVHLYQLPLGDFTAARNVLAKQAGARAAEVRGLQKPPLAAWAVNQLFWQKRDVYDGLADAANDLRAAHAAVLGGKRGDVRSAGKSHEESIEAALKAAIGILGESGHPVTDATRQAIATTLRALPGPEPPGQLTKTLQPGGFEMLAGLPLRSAGGRPGLVPRAPAPAAAAPPPAPAPRSRSDPDAQRRAREAAAQAEQEIRLAEHAFRREEFEAARAVREAEKAGKAVTAAKEGLKEAEVALAEAERSAQAADDARAAAEQRAQDARDALQAARERARALKAGR